MKLALKPTAKKIALSMTLMLAIVPVLLLLTAISAAITLSSGPNGVAGAFSIGAILLIAAELVFFVNYIIGLYLFRNNLRELGRDEEGMKHIINGIWIAIGSGFLAGFVTAVVSPQVGSVLSLLSLIGAYMMWAGAKIMTEQFRSMKFFQLGYLISLCAAAVSGVCAFLPEENIIVPLIMAIAMIASIGGTVLTVIGWWKLVAETSRLDDEQS